MPTLILTPEHDTLIGEDAATILRRGIPDSLEHVLPRTGHMFRFTHPALYSQHIAEFLSARGLAAGGTASPSRSETHAAVAGR